MNSPIYTLEFLENELNRYKAQKKSLQQQIYPKDQADSKKLLLDFYTEQINSLQNRIDTEKARNIEVKDAVEVSYKNRKHCQTRSKYLGFQSIRNQRSNSSITTNTTLS